MTRPIPKPELHVKQGALLPIPIGSIAEDRPVAFWNLQNCTVTFSMWSLDAAGHLDTKLIDAQPGEVVSIDDRIIQYEWVAGDTDLPGRYAGEFWVTFNDFSDSSPMKLPPEGYIDIYIGESW